MMSWQAVAMFTLLAVRAMALIGQWGEEKPARTVNGTEVAGGLIAAAIWAVLLYGAVS